MQTVQTLRHRAYAAGNLNSDSQVRVVRQDRVILVEPVNPQLVYVPYYDPTVIYGAWWWPAPPVYWRPWAGYAPGQRDAQSLQVLGLAYVAVPCLLKLMAAALLWHGWINTKGEE